MATEIGSTLHTSMILDGAMIAADAAVCDPRLYGSGFSFAYGYFYSYFSTLTPSSAARQVPHG